MKRILLALTLCLLPSVAFAQCSGIFPASTACGSVSGGLPSPIPFSSISAAAGGTNGQIQYNNGGVLGGTSLSNNQPVIGTGVGGSPGITTGTKTGNTTLFATGSGSYTNGHCVSIDANGNLVDFGSACAGSTNRIKLAVATTFYVATTGTDTAGCGLTVGSPCRTRGYLYNILASNYDFANQTVTVQLADGTYNDSLQANGPVLVGQSSASGLIFSGNCTTPTNVLIQPNGGSGYAYSADGGTSYRVQCQVVDQTNQRTVFPGGADIMVVGHGSRMYFGNPSLYGVRRDLIFGCNYTGFNAVTAAFNAYVEWDNDFDIDVGRCQQTPTGTVTSGSATITSVSSTTNVISGMGIVASGVPADAFVNTTTSNTITMLCVFTSPCQASSSPGNVTITLTGGGQTFLDMGNGATGYFATNGEPDFSLIATLANFPFYHAGWFFINEGSTINAQAITWVNPNQANGACSVVKSLSNIDTNLQGIPYLPCKSQSQELLINNVSLTGGAANITVPSTTGIKVGQLVTDVATPTATFTAGSPTMTVSSNTGICTGAKVTGPGVLGGAVVTNVSGNTITVGGCGPSGPKCVSLSPLYLNETSQTVYFSNCLMNGNAVVTFVNSSTVFSVAGDTPLAGAIKSTGTGNLWFQGQVIRYSVED